MENSLATLLRVLPSRFDVTLLGSSVEVLDYVAKGRSGTSIRLVPPIRGKRDILGITAHIRAVRQLRPDVFHASLGHLYQAQYPLFAAVVTGTPAVAVVHGVFPRTRRRQDVLVRWLIRRVRVVAGVSRFVCRSIESEFRLPPGTAQVLYNGIEDPGLPGSPVELDQVGTTSLGAIGRCAPEKGFDVLLRALVELPDCRLVVLGEGAARPELTRLAEDLGIAGRVEFVGWVDPPWSAQWSFDALVAPSRVEGFGLVAVEAMLAGVPVVASRVGGFAKIIDDGVTGLLVEAEDPRALAAAIRWLTADSERRLAMAKRARDSVDGRFGTEAMARAYEAVFDEARRK